MTVGIAVGNTQTHHTHTYAHTYATTTPTHYRLPKGFGNGASTAITIGIAVAAIVTDAVGRALIAMGKTLAILFLTLVEILKSQLYGHSA